ncbi:unnamed protein product [Auanema sp. JU1783]|nr:unnamed protein product [Auanema sp. JU1783]
MFKKIFWFLLVSLIINSSVAQRTTTTRSIDDEETIMRTGEGSGLIDDEDALEGSSLPPEIKYTTKSVIKNSGNSGKTSVTHKIAVVRQDTIINSKTVPAVVAPELEDRPLLESPIFLTGLGILVFFIIAGILIACCCCRRKNGYRPAKQNV